MILNQFKGQLALSEPLTREFVALMDGTFRYYSETRSLFFDKLSQHLLQSELISLINVEIKERLFDEKFCHGIKDALKAVQRAIIRLENLRQSHPKHSDTINNLNRLAALAERVEGLYQRHWEFYRYKGRINEEELVGFLLEIDQIAYQWDTYLTAFSATTGLLRELGGRAAPPETEPLYISYQRQNPQHFSVATLRSVMNFLEAGYRFVCTAASIDLEAHPLSLMQVEVAEPVELVLTVPEAAASVYRKFLQYLFLKDMLKREALLKVVFEAIGRDLDASKPLAATVLTAFQKEISGALKQLPEDGRFTISDRAFPEDGIRVLQEFTASLDQKNIRYGTLLRRETGKGTRARAAPKAAAAPAQPPEPPPRAPDSALKSGEPVTLFPAPGEKGHIAVLTDLKDN